MMVEISRFYKGAAVLFLGLTATIGGELLLANKNDGLTGFLSSNPFVKGPLELYDKDRANMGLRVAGGGIQIDNWNLSPKGDKVAYTVDGTPLLLHVVNINGQEDWVIPHINTLNPSWSSDGTMVAFISWGATSPGGVIPPGVWIANANSENPNPHRITTFTVDSSEYNPMWSPAENKIAYIKTAQFHYDDIWAINNDGSEEKALVTTKTGSIQTLEWSPDGKRIVFQCKYANSDSSSNGGSDIYIVDIATGNIKRLTTQQSDNLIFDSYAPNW